MTTKILNTDDNSITEGARILKSGGLVAFATETVYGLGANALDCNAVAKIFAVKGRPCDNPLIVHVASRRQLLKLVRNVPKTAYRLMDAFMPGALTLVLPKTDAVPEIVTGGLDTIAVRIPSNGIALSLLDKCGLPICAPSANKSGRPSPTKASHVLEDLNAVIDAVIDGGDCAIGVESTVVDFVKQTPRILRCGGVSAEDIKKISGKIIETVDTAAALAPGMKYVHYAPKCDMYLVAYGQAIDVRTVKKYQELSAQGAKPVIVCLQSSVRGYEGYNVMTAGATLEAYAKNIFDLLRIAEKSYTAIIAEGVPNDGIGRAITNRLIKSCGGNIL